MRNVRFVHLFIKSIPSLTNSLGRSARSWKVSDIVVERWRRSGFLVQEVYIRIDGNDRMNLDKWFACCEADDGMEEFEGATELIDAPDLRGVLL